MQSHPSIHALMRSHPLRGLAAALAVAMLLAGCGRESAPVHDPVVAQAPAPASADAPEAAPAAPPPPPGVEAAPDAEAPAVPGDPDISFGHRAGLHRVKDPLRLTSSAAFVIDQDNGEVLLAKNEDAVLPIASLTKLMTALVVAEAKLPLDGSIQITAEDVDRERNSRSRLRVGTELDRAEALHLALMSSENRAAHALGRTYPGGLTAFVEAMNSRARQLGMKQTTFVDPTGLSNRNQASAKDVAILAAAAARHDMVREYSTTQRRQVEFDGRRLQYLNSNRLVKHPAWDIVLQKTGYIVEAGQCVVMLTRIKGRNLMVVLLDAGDKRSRGADAERIRRWVEAQAGASSTHAETPATGTKS
jgi:D-alanyl-D-alanine endopeptidase (penicillin-binding protein 7)